MSENSDDNRFMAAAARFGRRHLGLTAENPSVGALIVRFDQAIPMIVGRGVTAKGGRPHAEVQALQEAGLEAKGATAYVTLEPCSHYGKTPPCSKALIEAGIKRVVIGVIDPDVRVSGQGISMLRQAGIQVDLLELEENVESGLNGYLKCKSKGMPEVTIKMAISADQAIGSEGRGFIAISNDLSRQRAHILRAETDAILVGIGTVLADDPMLDCRLPGLSARSPLRIVIDSDLRMPLTSKVVQTAHNVPTWVVCSKNNDQIKKEAFHAFGVTIIEMETDEGQIDLLSLLHFLESKGVANLLVEGGRKIAESFYNLALCDRLIVFQSGIKLGAGHIVAPKFENLEKFYRKTAVEHYNGDICTIWQRK